MDQALTIGVRYHAGHVLITVAGEIDIATVPQLRGQLTLLAAAGRPVIADLTGVTFLDAAGLGVLAGVVLARLGACEGIPAGGEVPAVFHGLLRDLVLAVRDLAGPAWLEASGDDPDVAAFTALQATPVPPSPAELDEIIARVLWARFAPPGPPRDGAGPAPGPAAGHDMVARSHVPAASHSR
jgi:STAS domain